MSAAATVSWVEYEETKNCSKGETINLCEPTKEFAGGDVWYKWLNNPSIMAFRKKYRKSKNTKEK